MNNAIHIQDEYIGKVSSYDPKGYNFSTLRTKAWRKAKAAIMDLGFPENQAHRMVLDANDMAELNRSAGPNNCSALAA